MIDDGADKVAIITGASRGIGAGLVETYRKRGYRVLVNSRSIADSEHPEVHTVAGDIADPATAEHLLDAAVSRFGRVDTLVNNAGVFRAKLAAQGQSAVPSALTALTKGGLVAATKSLAVEFAAQGIRVNAISPGVIDTPMHAGVDATTYAGMHPQNRIGVIADIAHGVLYLEDAAFVTGEILHVDGGQSAGPLTATTTEAMTYAD
jgi:NAD(P)-dependent dehydrogenase (short-subunit alcohol dehydrogenase family)